MKRVTRGGSKTREAKKATPSAIGIESARRDGREGRGQPRRTKYFPLIPKPFERTTYRKAFDLAKAGLTDQAASLLLKSHEQGDGRATYALATWYIRGKYFEVNKKKAVTLLKSAHKKGVREATFDLAYAYESGFGVLKSKPRAFTFYLDAANKGDSDAIEEVIRCVVYGIGFCKSRALAFLIHNLAEGPRSSQTQHRRTRADVKSAR